jgi:glycogen operon protein
MHVDGFRFDLAPASAAPRATSIPFGGFLDAIGQDPVLSRGQADRRAVGHRQGGYELGQLPAGWSEWNGRYRDTVRDFWRGAPGTLADFATRLTGSRTSTAAAGARRRRSTW